jgi:tartrate dehydratase alpha subunit/fumarate hydratase class I-like protein
MPKEAARIFLKVTNVRVERLQDITVEQAIKEGFNSVYEFNVLWDKTIKKQDLDKYGWNANPWVWVYEFESEVTNND